MKIVKRDGRTVDYNPLKIRIAIDKANKEVAEQERVSKADIDSIIEYIESLGKKRMLVEDIQDIIEEMLMKKGKYHLAKIYIIYRYKRSVIRQSNTIDASILSILKSNSYEGQTCLEVNRQRDVMAGEVSRDLAYRLLLPKNVVNAIQEEKIEFFNVEYFTEPAIEDALINLDDMFEQGTVINGIKIESPKSFQSAANILVEIIAAVASCQTGKIYIELKSIFKYYYLSYEKIYSKFTTLLKDSLSEEQIRAMSHTQAFMEVKTGIQTILYQINTIMTSKATVPKVYFIVDPRDINSLEEERIVYEFIRQKAEGIKDESGESRVTLYPMLIYVTCENEDEREKYEYMTRELALSKCRSIFMGERRFTTFKKEIGKFNQGTIIIDLAKIAESYRSNEEEFLQALKENLSYCYEGLLCRNHNLQGVYSNKSPIHWQYGAISRIADMEKIDGLLRKNDSMMILEVCGFEVATKILGESTDLKNKVRSLLEQTISTWNKESNFEVILSNEGYNRGKYDRELYERYGAINGMDSIDFVNDNYLKHGFIYIETKDSDDILSKDLLNKDLIIIKGSDD